MKELIINKLEQIILAYARNTDLTDEDNSYFLGQRDAYNELLKDLEDYNINNLYTL